MTEMGFGMTPGGASISTLNWDLDLIVPAAHLIQVDHITEKTAGHGVTMDVKPIMPTAAAGTNTTQGANTAFVLANPPVDYALWG